MIVYITKYALSKGIQRYEVPDVDKNGYHVFITQAMYHENFYKPHWHTDKKSAIQEAEYMRKKKLESLDKQIWKLRGLKFK